METKETKKPAVLIVDNENGQRIKVEVMAEMPVKGIHRADTGNVLIIKGSEKPLYVKIQKDCDPAFIWGDPTKHLSISCVIPVLLFLKGNNINCVKYGYGSRRIQEILNRISNGSNGSIKIARSSEMATAILDQELGKFFRNAAKKVQKSALCSKLKSLGLTHLIDQLYPEEEKES